MTGQPGETIPVGVEDGQSLLRMVVPGTGKTGADPLKTGGRGLGATAREIRVPWEGPG